MYHVIEGIFDVEKEGAWIGALLSGGWRGMEVTEERG